jgi:hypothetical protein
MTTGVGVGVDMDGLGITLGFVEGFIEDLTAALGVELSDGEGDAMIAGLELGTGEETGDGLNIVL